jgi:outer membrane protein assembly factor BamB
LYLLQDHGGASGSFIAAFDPETGKELWRTKRDAKVGWNSPVAIETGERDELIVSGQQKVTAYDPATGDELWFANGNTFEVIPTPVVAHGMLFCSSGRAGPTLAIRPGGSGDVTRSHVVWSSAKGSPFVVAPIAVGEYLYMVNDMASVLTVYEARTGEVAWQTRLGESKREGFSAAPVAFGDKVFFTNDEGETFVIRQGPEFEVLHVNRLEERMIASPALVEGIWYLRTGEALYALGGS